MQRVLPKLLSDHSLVFVEEGVFRNGSCPFKFKNMWLKENDVFDLLKEWWMGL